MKKLAGTFLLLGALASAAPAYVLAREKYRIAAFNWGLVDGKEQTRYPWDSWQRPYVSAEPPVWLHDLFHADGTPYRVREIEIIRALSERRDQPK